MKAKEKHGQPQEMGWKNVCFDALRNLVKVVVY